MNARQDSRQKGLADYESFEPCKKCHKPGWRRVSDNVCLMCHGPTLRRLARELLENQREQTEDNRRAARDRGETLYWSSVPCKVCDRQAWRRLGRAGCVNCTT